VTSDKDFGEKVFKEGHPHRGVVLLRLEDESAPSKIAVLQRLLASHADRLADAYLVVSEGHVRVAKAPAGG
jgi:hypothetical protein